MLTNTSKSYGWIAIIFHWLTALVVLGLFGLGWWMVELDYYSEWYDLAPHTHKSVGLLLATLLVLRVAWKLTQKEPEGLGSKAENMLAMVAHGVLYLLLFVLFISGYLISTPDGRGIEVFNWFVVPSLGELFENQSDIAGFVHEYIAYGLIALVVLHALAAFKHHLVNKDKTLIRMFKP